MALFSSPQLVQPDQRLRRPGSPVLAPGPTGADREIFARENPNAEQQTLLTEAPRTAQARSDATAQALKAAQRQRKRAAAGGRTLVTGQPLGAGINPGATFAPRTLLGGGGY